MPMPQQAPQEPQEELPQSPQPQGMSRQLPPQPVEAPTQPLAAAAPAGPAAESIDMEQVKQIVQVAMSQEFLQGFPQNVALEIQRLAKSVNMIVLRDDIPVEEKNRILGELLPELLKLMEARSEQQA